MVRVQAYSLTIAEFTIHRAISFFFFFATLAYEIFAPQPGIKPLAKEEQS